MFGIKNSTKSFLSSKIILGLSSSPLSSSFLTQVDCGLLDSLKESIVDMNCGEYRVFRFPSEFTFGWNVKGEEHDPFASFSNIGVVCLNELSEEKELEFERFSQQYNPDVVKREYYEARIIKKGVEKCVNEMIRENEYCPILVDGFPDWVNREVSRGVITAFEGVDNIAFNVGSEVDVSDLYFENATRGFNWGVLDGIIEELAETPANIATPTYLCDYFMNIQKDRQLPIEFSVFGEDWISRNGLGCVEAVSRGSEEPTRCLQGVYRGDPKKEEIDICLVGKGITFDAGGYNIKPTKSMAGMQMDMAGAASVFSSIIGLSMEEVGLNVVAFAPLCENMISGNSLKPGDLVKSHSGKEIEIGNTDAEGRLLLADALSYCVQEFSPSAIVDIATLTGAISVALDDSYGAFSNDNSLWNTMEVSSLEVCSSIWRMPVFSEHFNQLESKVGDLKNIGKNGAAASSVASAFLEDFVSNVPWIHLDIAGAFSTEGIRCDVASLIIQFCQNYEKRM